MSVVFNKGDLTDNFVEQAGGYVASAPDFAVAVVSQLDGLNPSAPVLEVDAPGVNV